MTGNDFSALKAMKYSGRGIVLGATPSGAPFVGYSLTGRSPSSQARKLVYDKESNVIRTDVTDRAQLEKGSPILLIYPAIIFDAGAFVASNGAQTNLLYSNIQGLVSDPERFFAQAFGRKDCHYDAKDKRFVDTTKYEPDDPNFTPRISGCLDTIPKIAGFHIVRKRGTLAEPKVFPFPLVPGEGRAITTYAGGNENPLLPFEGEPLRVGIKSESAQDIAESLYDAVRGGEKPGDNFRVAAAVAIRRPLSNLEVAIINRCERGD
jgi:IMP cyclohydrolase